MVHSDEADAILCKELLFYSYLEHYRNIDNRVRSWKCVNNYIGNSGHWMCILKSIGLVLIYWGIDLNRSVLSTDKEKVNVQKETIPFF